MNGRFFPPPSQGQARVIWLAVTALCVAIFLAVLGMLIWGLGWVLQKLTPVLLPLAVAGILAYLLDPLVDLFERWGFKRPWAIGTVFLIGLLLIVGAFGTVIPQLVYEARDLAVQIPDYAHKMSAQINTWLQNSPLGSRVKAAWTEDVRNSAQVWATNAVPAISSWFVAQAGRIASWVGFVAGAALIPVYLFYLLLEKRGITSSWTDYLPVQESKTKQEIVFILQSINDYLILFFRGQVLVALCDGILLTIGFLSIGLNYALLLGIVAGVLSIVPFLGVIVSIVPAVILAIVQFGDWLHPALVLGLFAVVQLLEGFVIAPKIMGDRVGLHPLTIMIAVMVGTTLMGGIIGGILAIPLTAALRVLMFRYVWYERKPTFQTVTPDSVEGTFRPARGEENPA